LADFSTGTLVGALTCLILLSAFFSGAEIALMTINRYRLRHLADSGHRGARVAAKLLERPDRLLGVILVGNNFANIAASSVATLLALELYGEHAVAIAAFLLTFVVLVFAEVAPKTYAALQPERMAYPAAFVLRPLLLALYPIVWLVNAMGNLLLRLLGVSVLAKTPTEVTAEELKALVREADVLLPKSHQEMLLAILELEKLRVDDVMVPRNKIVGIDLDAEWDEIVSTLTSIRFTRIPAYRRSLDNIVGVLHVRRVLNLVREERLNIESLTEALIEPYFIPSGTPLNTQLLNFQKVKRRIGLVVDEYGDIQGLVTLDEILEEIVGDFTARAIGQRDDVQPQPDGSYLVRGTIGLRDLNRTLGWNLPLEESRTLNGWITEYLEDLPEPGTSLMLHGYVVEILRTRGTSVEVARIRPAAESQAQEPAQQDT